jgi:hypothetical protein
MNKTVYFATGTPEEAAADLRGLLHTGNPADLRVVVPADATGREAAARLEPLASVRSGQILVCGFLNAPLVWIRLWMFLGRARGSRVICWKAAGRGRFLKLLAAALPGELIFSAGPDAQVSCRRKELLRAAWRQATAAQGPVCVIGSASGDDLARIVRSVRERYADVPVHAMFSAARKDCPAGLFDSQERLPAPLLAAYLRLLPRCLGKRRFRRIIIPWTNDRSIHNARGLKWLAWLLPRWPVEVYNENLDAFTARNPLSLGRHFVWRSKQASKLRYMRREVLFEEKLRKLEERKRRHRALPVGVVGSASGYYLKRIVPVVRAAFPEAKIHGLLPASLKVPAEGLFDSTTVLESGFARRVLQGWRLTRKEFQCWVVPCTDEHYAGMKLLAAFLPLGPRHIYNELADGFPLRKLGTFYQHLAWRMRDHLSFQIFTGAAGRNFFSKAIHFAAYAVRLSAGAALLAKVRIGVWLNALLRGGSAERYARGRAPSHPTPETVAVDLIVLQGGEDSPVAALPVSRPGLRLRIAARVPLDRRPEECVEEINLRIRQSAADYICILDSRCRMTTEDWIERLLESFDDRTAQAGPQVSFSDGGVVRGGLLSADRQPRWNSNNSVCWHRRPEWLDTETIPWVCVLIRRSVFGAVGYFGGACERDPLWVDLDFCARLGAHGWKSICNQNVIAVFAAEASPEESESVVAASRLERSSEEVL